MKSPIGVCIGPIESVYQYVEALVSYMNDVFAVELNDGLNAQL